ncbi:hypothetical protein F4678DRAFT_31072 [Xylaria arbuscula]|nr:hypothetical protein F4678DRAFT_31072 [Xylaria arbuscula]
MPHPKPQRRTPSAEALMMSETRTQSQQHVRFSSSSSSSRPAALLPSDTKRRNAHAHGTHGSRIPSPPQEVGSVVRSGRPQRQNTERISCASTAESRRPRSPGLTSSDQARRTRAILSSPRLQRVTGLLPRNIDLWADREFPPSELRRLAWAMTLPEPFPRRRPRGETQTSVPPTVRKA